MKHQRRNTEANRRKLPAVSRGDLLRAGNINTIHRAVNAINGFGFTLGGRETRRCRVKITAKDGATKVCEGSVLHNTLKTGASWAEAPTPIIFKNIVDDDDSVKVNDEAWAHYCPQDGQWHIRSNNEKTADTGPTGEDDDGDFNCCECENSKLYASAENPGITVEKITYPRSLVSGTSPPMITHKIRVTCNADGATQDFTLDPISCDGECNILDLTGTMVGSCDVGLIFYGNQEECAPVSDTGPECTEPGLTGVHEYSDDIEDNDTARMQADGWSFGTNGGGASVTASGGSLRIVPGTSFLTVPYSTSASTPYISPEFSNQNILMRASWTSTTPRRHRVTANMSIVPNRKWWVEHTYSGTPDVYDLNVLRFEDGAVTSTFFIGNELDVEMLALRVGDTAMIYINGQLIDSFTGLGPQPCVNSTIGFVAINAPSDLGPINSELAVHSCEIKHFGE